MPTPEQMTLLDSAACGLLQTDDKGVIRWANGVFCAWIGYGAEEIIDRRKIQELFTIGGRIFHQTHWLPLIQMQQSVSEVKFDLVHANGSTIPMVINGIRRSHGGDIVHDIAVFVARDRDKYERELIIAGQKLKELVDRSVVLEEEARDRAVFAEQMMGIVSHDLRNPLATVELSALTMLGGGVEPGHRDALMRITRATSRAGRLIHDLLDFTQARLGKGLAVTRSEIDLHAVMAEAVEELRHAFPGRTLFHLQSGAGGCEADADRLMQLVGNLVTNAITYGRAESTVTVTSSTSNDLCFIAVHNEGSVIDAEMAAQLFLPMVRGAKNPDGGRSVGLGLYIVREIAKAHGGDVSVTSTSAGGTTFTAQFPCRALQEALTRS